MAGNPKWTRLLRRISIDEKGSIEMVRTEAGCDRRDRSQLDQDRV
jgi:hypothetical protein